MKKYFFSKDVDILNERTNKILEKPSKIKWKNQDIYFL